MPEQPVFEPEKTAEEARLDEAREKGVPWKLWGPYLSGDRLIDIEHRPGRQADRQNAAGQLVPIFICKARAQRLRQRIPIDKARGVGREPRIACQFRHAEKLAELSKGGVVAGGNEDLACPGLEFGIRCEIGMRVTGSLSAAFR